MYIRLARASVKPKRPVFGLGCPGCSSRPALLARRLGRRLGQDDDSGLFYTPGEGGVIQAGGPTYEPGAGPAPSPPDISATGIPGSAAAAPSLTSQQLQNIATGGLNVTPGTTPATLLQAAQLPGAPASVVQAAAQYRAANPITAGISQSLLGFPLYYWILGGLGLFALAALASKRR